MKINTKKTFIAYNGAEGNENVQIFITGNLVMYVVPSHLQKRNKHIVLYMMYINTYIYTWCTFTYTH
jgi:hypothetical protein